MRDMNVFFKTFEEYLRELELGQTGRPAECMNTFQLGWKVKVAGNFKII